MNRTLLTLLAAGLPAAAVFAEPFSYSGNWSTPTLDRWMYPFGDASGTATRAPNFSTLWSGYTIFDDRDSEFLVGFNTSTQVPAGFPAERYRVSAVTVRASVNVPDAVQTFAYDPTVDPLTSYYDPGDPNATPPRAADPTRTEDPDAGRPIELFALAYRNGITAVSFAENTPFNFGAPSKSSRNAYPVDFGGPPPGLVARDVSNNVTDRFVAQALAVGRAFDAGGVELTPGVMVADLQQFRFDVTLSAGTLNYVQQGLSAGRLNFAITSLHAATSFGAGPATYPVWRTKEDPLVGGNTAKLSVSVVLCLGDVGSQGGLVGPDGLLDNNDFVVFINAFFGGDGTIADVGTQGGVVGRDGQFTNDDFVVFVNAFFAGC